MGLPEEEIKILCQEIIMAADYAFFDDLSDIVDCQMPKMLTNPGQDCCEFIFRTKIKTTYSIYLFLIIITTGRAGGMHKPP
jgi:hypothetical protein